jgi:hypothetical protein
VVDFKEITIPFPVKKIPSSMETDSRLAEKTNSLNDLG